MPRVFFPEWRRESVTLYIWYAGFREEESSRRDVSLEVLPQIDDENPAETDKPNTTREDHRFEKCTPWRKKIPTKRRSLRAGELETLDL